MNEHEISRIAAAIAMLRPDWPAASIRTLLARPELAARPRRDVAVALTWVACDGTTKTPARVLEAGPWWKATATDAGSSLRVPFDRRTWCHVCGKPEPECRDVGDHTFLSVERARGVRSAPVPEQVRAAVAARAHELCSHGVPPLNCGEHRSAAVGVIRGVAT